MEGQRAKLALLPEHEPRSGVAQTWLQQNRENWGDVKPTSLAPGFEQ